MPDNALFPHSPTPTAISGPRALLFDRFWRRPLRGIKNLQHASFRTQVLVHLFGGMIVGGLITFLWLTK